MSKPGASPMFTDRRTLLQVAAALPLIATGATATLAQTATPAAPAKPPVKGVTRALAKHLVNANYDDLPGNVRKEGVRTLLNWVGVAIGGSHHQTVDIPGAPLGPLSGP